VTSPDDLLRGIRPERPPMPDHVRRAIDARLSEAAWQETRRLEQDERSDGRDADEAADAVIARLDDFRVVPAPRRRLPAVAAVVAILVGAVGAIALTVDRGAPEPVATSVARPDPVSGDAVDGRPPEPTPPGSNTQETASEVTAGIAPEVAEILDGLPTTGLDPDRLDAALAGIDGRATGAEADQRGTASAVIAGVACAWVGHWHDAVLTGDATEADRATAVFADLDQWTPWQARASVRSPAW
jgi:hypothetical protein